MTKTTLDLCTLALRMIKVTAVDETPAAEDYDQARLIAEAEFDYLVAAHDIGWTHTLNTTPDALYEPMARVIAAKIAPAFHTQGPNYARAVGLLRAYSLEDDRADRRDIDNDGSVSQSEIEVDQRAQFY